MLHRRTLLASLLFLSIPAVAHAAGSCPVPGFEYAAFGDTGISMGNGNTDSYDTTLGAYATSQCSLMPPCLGGVATNNSNSGGISLGPNASVQGECQIGAGGTAANITPNASKCATLGVQGSHVSLPIPALPGTLAGALGAVSNTITIPATGEYSMTSLTLAGNKHLDVGAGPVVIYLTGSGQVLKLTGNGAINNNTQIPSNLIFMCTSNQAQTIDIAGNGNAYYGIYCPKADITIAGNGDIYGAIVGKSVTFNGNNGFVHYDHSLSTFTTGAISCTTNEVSRATPIIADISNQSCVLQGTFKPPTSAATTILTTADVANFEFPHVQGHMRARVSSSVTTTASEFSTGTIVFDAADHIPPVVTGGCATGTNGEFRATCRNVFTNVSVPPASGTTTFTGDPLSRLTLLDDTNATTVGQLIAPAGTGTNQVPNIGPGEWQTIVRRVLQGTSNGTVAALGGVDRSTVAVIGSSNLAGNSQRPTMTYFGGDDGMLHAVCSSVGGTTDSASNICPALGTELWAFLPRVQLPLVRVNKQRLDGSVRVVDAFGAFPDPTSGATAGTRTFRTILTFQTGYSDSSLGSAPAVYALDVTDPAKPILLWEFTTPATTGPQLGVGLAMHAGATIVSGAIANLAIAQTNNGGSGGAGMVVNGLSLETGVPKWTSPFSYIYASPRPSSGTYDGAIPTTGIPGGAVGIDLARAGFTTDVVMGDLYGNLWRLDAATGANTTVPANQPLFSFSTDRHPIGALPSILDDGRKIAVFGTGGYADPSGAPQWTTTDQRVVGVVVDKTAPIDESSPTLAFSDTLTNQRISSQVLVVGGKVFVTTDTDDINASGYGTNGSTTGSAYALDTTTQTPALVFLEGLRGGASSLAFDGSSSLVGGAADMTQRLATTASTSGGTSVDYQNTKKITRLVWLRGRL